jgi:hypothetical protein
VRNLSHAHGSDTPAVDQIGMVDRGSDHSRSHDRVEPVAAADRHCRVAGYSVERMHHSEEANAR